MGSFIIGAFMVCKFPAVATWNVIEPQKEREVFCLCCAFSAVLSGFRHSLPCEACRENVSHGVIVTNPPPHHSDHFSPSTFLPTIRTLCWPCPFFYVLNQKVDFYTAEPWRHRKRSVSGCPSLVCQVTAMCITAMCLFQSLYSCWRSLFWFDFPQCNSLFMQFTRAQLEYPLIVRKHTVGACEYPSVKLNVCLFYN